MAAFWILLLFFGTLVHGSPPCQELPYKDVVLILDTSSLNNVPEEFDGMRRFAIELMEWVASVGSTVHTILFGEEFLILGTDVELVSKELLAMTPTSSAGDDEPALGSFDASFAFASVLRDINMRKKPGAMADQSKNLLPIFEQFPSPDSVLGIMLFSTFLTPMPSRVTMEELHRLSAAFMTIDNACGTPAGGSQDYLASETSLSRTVNSFMVPGDVISLLNDAKNTLCFSHTTTTKTGTTRDTTRKSTTTATTSVTLETSTLTSPKQTTKTPMKFYFRPTTVKTPEPLLHVTELEGDSVEEGRDGVSEEHGLTETFNLFGPPGGHDFPSPETPHDVTGNMTEYSGQTLANSSQLSESGGKRGGEQTETKAGNLSSKYIITILLVTLGLVVAISVALVVLRSRKKEESEKYGGPPLSKSPDELESLSSASSTYKEPPDGFTKSDVERV